MSRGRKESPREYTNEGTPYLGTKLWELRTGSGASQTFFGSEFEVTAGLISKIERGHVMPTKDFLNRIAGKFGIPIEELTGLPIQPKLMRDSQRSEVLVSREDLSLSPNENIPLDDNLIETAQMPEVLINMQSRITVVVNSTGLKPEQYQLAEGLIRDTVTAIIHRLSQTNQ